MISIVYSNKRRSSDTILPRITSRQSPIVRGFALSLLRAPQKDLARYWGEEEEDSRNQSLLKTPLAEDLIEWGWAVCWNVYRVLESFDVGQDLRRILFVLVKLKDFPELNGVLSWNWLLATVATIKRKKNKQWGF